MDLQKERIKRNLSQVELAAILKISPRQLQRFEAGEPIRYLIEKGIESCLKSL